MDLLIGSHVSFKSDKQLLGSVEEALRYGSNTFMFYTGAPQNTKRNKIDKNLTDKAHKLMKDNNIDINKVVVHAPYIINLANNKDKVKYQFAIDFLKKEIDRCEELGISKIVLHPGSYVDLTKEEGIKNIIEALNSVIDKEQNVNICLEVMAGKGSEIGRNIEELKVIYDGVKYKDKILFCLDTCHMNDAGIDLNNFDKYLDEFDKTLGLSKIGIIHINDTKNNIGEKKDRHENIGFGKLGFSLLLKIIYHEKLKEVPKILETPYVDRIYPPYKQEIDMIRKKEFNPNLIEDIKKYYQ